MSDSKLKTASVLAFERKLDPSDALFFAGDWNRRDGGSAWRSLGLSEKSVRGTISNRLKTKDHDPAKLDAMIESPNLQTVDVAALPHDCDTLKVTFTLRVLAGTGTPSACNDAAYRQRLQETVQGYAQTHSGFGTLARRYAQNLANGRFLWRNRVGAEEISIVVRRLKNGAATKTWTFDALRLSLRDFEAAGEAATALDELASVIDSGLRDAQAHVLFDVTAFVRIGAGQEVFPSQELILERGRGDKSKTLYKVGEIAGIHSQKIGNALRTIDTWYPGAANADLGPIAVEPYGSVTTQGKAYRQPKEHVDFYSLLDNWVLKGKAPETGDQHYVMAVLIRGGVFGEAA